MVHPVSYTGGTNLMQKTIPFKIPNTHGGFADCHGLIQKTDEGISLQFQPKDNFFGAIKGHIRLVEIPISEIEEIEMTTTLVKNWIVIRMANLHRTRNVPCKTPGEVRLAIARKDKPQAEELLSQLQLEIAEERLRQTREE